MTLQLDKNEFPWLTLCDPGSVVRHFKQKNLKGAVEIAAAIDEGKESQALSLVSQRSVLNAFRPYAFE